MKTGMQEVFAKKKKKKSKFAKYNSVPKLMIYSIPPICKQHVINNVFTYSILGPHGIVDRAVGSGSKGLGFNSLLTH